MVRRRSIARVVGQLVVVVLVACSPTNKTNPAAPTTNPTTFAPQGPQASLFYAKAGSLYVSDPGGDTPARKLTDGPADTQPAPSPDGMHVAYVHKANASDYGGELWVLDLSPQRTPVGAPRRFVDPAALPEAPWKTPGHIVSPRWSPTGKQIAFLHNDGSGQTVGGLLLVAAADTGTIVAPRQPLFANDQYAWAPDGKYVAWTNARSDVSPVDVSALEVGGASTPVAKDTNAFSVTYRKDGQAILFTNGDASGPDFTGIPFALRDGGIYAAATLGGAPANPPAHPTSLLARQGSYYGDVAALGSGAVAFTETHHVAGHLSKSILVLDAQSSVPRTIIANVAGDGQGPAWGADDAVAYVQDSPGSPLIVTDVKNRAPKQVDTGVESFAWQ